MRTTPKRNAPAKRSGLTRRSSIIRVAASRNSDLCEIQYVDEQRVRAAQRGMKAPVAVGLLAQTFKVLGDPNRVRIAWALATQELCVCDLAALFGMSQSAVSHSLRALRQLGLVKYRKAGAIAYYKLDDDHISNLLAEGFCHIEEHG